MALNHIDLMGRLVADPELRKVGDDVSVVSFRLAVDRDRKNKDTGERDADFINVSAWRSTADFIAQYFAKGDMMVVSGRLQSRMYEDKDGNKRSAYDVVADTVYFGASKKESGQTEAGGGDDELPF
nr:MAG TPA: Single strand binding protein [Caudoviricetes sp.]